MVRQSTGYCFGVSCQDEIHLSVSHHRKWSTKWKWNDVSIWLTRTCWVTAVSAELAFWAGYQLWCAFQRVNEWMMQSVHFVLVVKELCTRWVQLKFQFEFNLIGFRMNETSAWNKAIWSFTDGRDVRMRSHEAMNFGWSGTGIRFSWIVSFFVSKDTRSCFRNGTEKMPILS